MFNVGLFSLVETVMREGKLENACLQAGNIIEEGIGFPQEIESRLIDFASNKDEVSFVSFLKEVLYGNYLNDYEKNIRVIAFLVSKNWLSVKDAVLFLSSVPYVERSRLSKSFIYAVEVADLIFEDFNEGFMEADDDDLLVNALKEIDWLRTDQEPVNNSF